MLSIELEKLSQNSGHSQTFPPKFFNRNFGSFALTILPVLSDDIWLLLSAPFISGSCVGVECTLCSPILLSAPSAWIKTRSNSAITSSVSSISLAINSSAFSSFDSLRASIIFSSSSFRILTFSFKVPWLCFNHTTSFSGLSLLNFDIASTILATSFFVDDLWPPRTRRFLIKSSAMVYIYLTLSKIFQVSQSFDAAHT